MKCMASAGSANKSAKIPLASFSKIVGRKVSTMSCGASCSLVIPISLSVSRVRNSHSGAVKAQTRRAIDFPWAYWPQECISIRYRLFGRPPRSMLMQYTAGCPSAKKAEPGYTRNTDCLEHCSRIHHQRQCPGQMDFTGALGTRMLPLGRQRL